MLNNTEKQKIKSFIADEKMSDAVKKVLREIFMRDKQGDVYAKASQMMAINLLEDGFKEMERQTKKVIQEERDKKQIGL